MPDLIRHPVPRQHWIAGQARNDKPEARNDKVPVMPDSIRHPVVRTPWIAPDQVRGRLTSSPQ